MRSNSHRQWPSWLRLPPAGARLLAIAAALTVMALAVGACNLTAAPPGTDNGGFSSSSGSVTTGKGQTTPVKIIRGGGGTALVLIPLTIDGQGPYDFALDTGAGITLIDMRLADDLHLPVAGQSAQVSGVGGTQDVTPVRIDSWSAGKITLPTANVGKTELSSFQEHSDVRGLLGSDILSRFGRITINYDSGELSTWDGSTTTATYQHQSPARDALAETPRAALRAWAA